MFLAGSRERAPYAKIAHMLRGLVDRHGWEAKHEDDNIVGAKVSARMTATCTQRGLLASSHCTGLASKLRCRQPDLRVNLHRPLPGAG